MNTHFHLVISVALALISANRAVNPLFLRFGLLIAFVAHTELTKAFSMVLFNALHPSGCDIHVGQLLLTIFAQFFSCRLSFHRFNFQTLESHNAATASLATLLLQLLFPGFYMHMK